MTRRFVISFFGLAVVACSGTTASPATSSSVQQACADQARAKCTRLATCSATTLQIRYGDEATCEARESASCNSVLAAPSNGNNPTHVEGCAQAYAGWACGDYLDDANIPAACAQQKGSIPSGQTCSVAGQCASGFCAIAPGDACGSCAEPPKAGDSCAALTTCGPGLVCTSDTSTCVLLASNGASCGKGQPCGAGLSCVGADATKGTSGTCMPAVVAPGAACDATQKMGAACDRNAGLACDSMSKQCAAIVLASSGQACGTVNSQTTPCASGGTCSGAMAGKPGTCVAAAADGAPCDLANGPGCMSPARCVVTSGDGGTAGTCQLGAVACP